jgi:hypothetical protein
MAQPPLDPVADIAQRQPARRDCRLCARAASMVSSRALMSFTR